MEKTVCFSEKSTIHLLHKKKDIKKAACLMQAASSFGYYLSRN